MDTKPEPWRKSTLALLSGLFLLAGCDKQAAVEDFARSMVLARGRDIPDLVFAASAPDFDPGDVPFIEGVRREGAWHIHKEDMLSAPCRSSEEIDQAVRGMRVKHADQRMVISAAGNTPFTEIRTMVRGAAMAGFSRVDFLVSTASRKRKNHTLPLTLPTPDGTLNEIDPMLVRVDEKGHVFLGSGASQSLLASDPEEHTLPKLDATLELFSAAARAAQCQPFCMIYVDPAAPYQRVIDVLSRFHDHQITRLGFIDLVERHDKTGDGMNSDHKERMELLKSKPRPPAPSSQSLMRDP